MRRLFRDLRYSGAFNKKGLVRLQVVLCMSFTVGLSGQLLAAQQQDVRKGAFYRYTMPDGRTEVGRQVPIEAVDGGYEVLDKRMRTISRVAPAPSAEEIAIRAKKSKQRYSDDKLLQTFATSMDAERARDRKIAALDVIVNISKGNILRLNLEYETLAAVAAAKMRRGMAVPEHVQDNMNSTERQIQEAQAHIQMKEVEKQSIFQDYQPDIQRLKELESVATVDSKGKLTRSDKSTTSNTH